MPSKKSQRKQKKTKTLRRRYKKGGCGSCKSSEPSPFLTGGSLNHTINQNPVVIPYNQSHGSSMDPNDPSNMVSVRMQPNMITGGSRSLSQHRVLSNKKRSTPIKIIRKSNKISNHNPFKGGKKQKRKTYKLKGGNADPSAANAISSFGNTTGLSSTYNILTGSQSVNSSVTSQPIGDSPFGPHNPALV